MNPVPTRAVRNMVYNLRRLAMDAENLFRALSRRLRDAMHICAGSGLRDITAYDRALGAGSAAAGSVARGGANTVCGVGRRLLQMPSGSSSDLFPSRSVV